ncbi:MAG: PAS domain-containing protein, partial [Eubacteriales bacterium]|nr:PAS domain-containing protein [Eubacteriales bacterium]
MVWITPEDMHHFLSEGAVLAFLRRQMAADVQSRYVDLSGIKSSPSADNVMTVAYEVTLVPREEESERPLHLRCSMAICRRGRRLEITFLHFSKKAGRDGTEQLRDFVTNLPCGVMILACLDGKREEAVFYNAYFANRLRYGQEEFGRAMRRNPFFMTSEEDRGRIQEEIEKARKNGGNIAANLRFYRRDGNSFFYRMVGVPAYQADGGTVYYCVFQEITGFQLTTDRLQGRLDTAGEILRQIPEAFCCIEIPEGAAFAAGRKDSKESGVPAGAGTDPGNGTQEDDVRISDRAGGRAAKKSGPAPGGAAAQKRAKVFFTSKNVPALFGVSNSAYMKNILEDPFYGLEITSITRDRLMSSHILNPEKASVGKPVSCGVFRLKKQDGRPGGKSAREADGKLSRVELVVRRTLEKDGTARLYLFYYDCEAQQQEMEKRVDRAMQMGRAGQEQLRADLRKAKENAARRLSEAGAALKEAQEKHAAELSRAEDQLLEEKNRAVLMSRQLEEARAVQKQMAADLDRSASDTAFTLRNTIRRAEADAARRIREIQTQADTAARCAEANLADALAKTKDAEAARDLLEEQLREAQTRCRQLEAQVRKETARRQILEEQYLQMKKGAAQTILPDMISMKTGAAHASLPDPALANTAAEESQKAEQAIEKPVRIPSHEDWMTAESPVTVYSHMDSLPEEDGGKGVYGHVALTGSVAAVPEAEGRVETEKRMEAIGRAALTGSVAAVPEVEGRADTGGQAVLTGAVVRETKGSVEAERRGKRMEAVGPATLTGSVAAAGGDAERIPSPRFREESFSPEKWIREILEQEEKVCREKNISLRFYCDSRLPRSVSGYADLLRRALFELLENAAARTQPGGRIAVHCRADRPSGGLVNLYFRIDDNGLPIPEKGMQAIFRPQSLTELEKTADSGNPENGLEGDFHPENGFEEDFPRGNGMKGD